MDSQRNYLLDFSLALVNRTGAYVIGRDLLRDLPEFFSDVRYWRLMNANNLDGVPRKIAARLMMKEIEALRGSNFMPWPDGQASKGRPRVFLDPLYVLRSRLEPQDIVQCHDIGPLTHPDLFGDSISGLYREAYEKIRAVGPGMVFVSDATQAAFRRELGESYRFLQTIPLYVREGVLSGGEERVTGLDRPFLLTVGALETRKNHLRIIEAYEAAGLNQRGFDYVICGSRGIGHEDVIRKAGLTAGVKVLGFVSDAQLRWLYLNGSGFVLPSLLEGVGLPPLEAAQRGLVPLVSADSAQEEAIGGAGILVNPESVESIREGLLRLVDIDPLDKADILKRAADRGRALSYARYIGGWRKVLSLNDRFQTTDGWAASDPEEADARI